MTSSMTQYTRTSGSRAPQQVRMGCCCRRGGSQAGSCLLHVGKALQILCKLQGEVPRVQAQAPQLQSAALLDCMKLECCTVA